MPKWRVLLGAEVLAILATFGFLKIGQAGSHVKVQRVIQGPRRQTLTVPLHRELDRGTLHAIFRQAVRFIPESELRVYFQID